MAAGAAAATLAKSSGAVWPSSNSLASAGGPLSASRSGADASASRLGGGGGDIEGGVAVAGDAFGGFLGDPAVSSAMVRLMQSAPRFLEGSLVPQVRETLVLDGITLPVVPVIAGWVGAYPLEARSRRLDLFLDKRQRRVWEKTVKYDVRKSFADSRLRVKGRFVKKEDESLLRDFMQLL